MKNQLEIKKYIRVLIEVSIWFLFLFLLINGCLYLKNRESMQYETYQIFMPDVDGVIVGSAVNMMGVQVGYVKQINIINNEVYVKFTLNKKGLKIPKGSVVTVEFSGLGGSKSLVIYPSKEYIEGSAKHIVVQEPTRINDSINLMFEMFDKLAAITFRFSHASKEINNVIKNEKEYLENSNDEKQLDKKQEIITKKEKKTTQDIIKTLKQVDKKLEETTEKIKK